MYFEMFNFQEAYLQQIATISICSISCESALTWNSQDLTDDIMDYMDPDVLCPQKGR